MSNPSTRHLAGILLFAAICCGLPTRCPGQAPGQSHEVLCSNGFGSYDSAFSTGVTVYVGAIRKGGFAQRACEAAFRWGRQDLVIEPKAFQVDIDVLGVDLGLGSPVVAFLVKDSYTDSVVHYEIYSLQKHSQKLRTLTGGSYFSAADTDLDGHIEIWTDDAKAVDGFENIPLSAFDSLPTIVLRFEHRKLLDTSSEFQPDFDRKIAGLRSQLDPQQLKNFKDSDGIFSNRFLLPTDEYHALLATKIKVLEIVWGYLYSGREEEAWNTLTELWPASDTSRIRTAILDARAHGIRSQIDGISDSLPRFHVKKHALIFDAAQEAETKTDHMRQFEVDKLPREILIMRPPLPDTSTASLKTETVLQLVLDSAGKVRSVKTEHAIDKDLVDATADWKFIPAFKDGNPVACRMRFGVTPDR